MNDNGFFPLSPVFENCVVDIALIKNCRINISLCFVDSLEFYFDSLKKAKSLNMIPKFLNLTLPIKTILFC